MLLASGLGMKKLGRWIFSLSVLNVQHFTRIGTWCAFAFWINYFKIDEMDIRINDLSANSVAIHRGLTRHRLESTLSGMPYLLCLKHVVTLLLIWGLKWGIREKILSGSPNSANTCQVMTILPILSTRWQLSLLSNTETLLLGMHTWQASDID